jgi:S-adenosylmethionine hydrolase
MPIISPIFGRSNLLANRIDGKVTRISEKGALISDISVDQLKDVPSGETTSVKFGDHETFGLFPVNHGQPDATMVASLGVSGFLEIEIVGIPLAEMLGIRTGENVTVQW